MNQYELLLELMIFESENKIQYFAQSYKKKILDGGKDNDHVKVDSRDENELVKAIVTELNKADPDDGKNLGFIVKMYADGQFRFEDLKKIKDTIESFKRVRTKLEKRDLMAYKNLGELYDAIEPFENVDVKSNKAIKQEIKTEGTKVLFKDKDFLVIQPTTAKAAEFYAAGTKWCTSSEDTFKHYASQGDLIIVIATIGGKTRKWQYHIESEQFMDERDQEISKADIAALSKFPKYRDFVEHLIDKHYSKYMK